MERSKVKGWVKVQYIKQTKMKQDPLCSYQIKENSRFWYGGESFSINKGTIHQENNTLMDHYCSKLHLTEIYKEKPFTNTKGN